jgi:hypothetical protein
VTRTLTLVLMLGLVGAAVTLGPRPAAVADKKGKKMLSHDVYFALNESTPEARQKLVEACKKYLSGHPGEVFFTVGVLAEEFARPVNDREFDVALHIVFADKAAHDKYQDAPRHHQFIDENKAGWKKVRVFDSYVEKP